MKKKIFSILSLVLLMCCFTASAEFRSGGGVPYKQQVTDVDFTSIEINTVSNTALTGDGAGGTDSVSEPYFMSKQGDYLYCQFVTGGAIKVIDVSDRKSPVVIGKFTTTHPPQKIKVIGDRIYVAEAQTYVAGGGSEYLYFSVFGIINPTTITLIQTLAIGISAGATDNLDFVIQGDKAYITHALGKALYVVALGNNTSRSSTVIQPMVIMNTASSLVNLTPYSITARNGLVYIVGSGEDVDHDYLEIWNIDNPNLPVLKSTTNIGGTALQLVPSYIALKGQYAYISTYGSVTWGSGDNGNGHTRKNIYIYDISVPTAPVYVSVFTANRFASFLLYVQGEYLYSCNYGKSGTQTTSDEFGSIDIFDISTPTAPILKSSYIQQYAQWLIPDGLDLYVNSYSNNILKVLETTGLNVPAINVGTINMGAGNTKGDFGIAKDLTVGGGAYIGGGGLAVNGNITHRGTALPLFYGGGINVDGASAETIRAVIQLPTGALKAGSSVQGIIWWSKAGTTATPTATFKVYLNTAASLSGAQVIWVNSDSTAANIGYRHPITLACSSTTLQYTNSLVGWQANTTVNTTTVDTSGDVYILLTTQYTTAGGALIDYIGIDAFHLTVYR